ncbi:MAG: exopolysaccharide transport family protein [Acidobacteriaceae bacterium]
MNSAALISPHRPLDPPVEWTLADLFAAFSRRRSWIFSSLAACIGLAIAYWAFATPNYRATAVIEIQKESHGAFGLDNTTSDGTSRAVSDSFDDNLTLQTEIGVLQSDALTLDVIRRTGLESTPDYFAPHSGASVRLHKLVFWRKPVEPLSIPLADAPNRRFSALKIFTGRRRIEPAAGTRLIAISYSDPDPARAAAVVNALVQSLADYGFQSRSSAAARSASWLSAQLAGLKHQTDTLDARAAALDRDSGSYNDNDAHNVVLDRLDSLNSALAAAESSRIVREAIWRAVQSGDPEVISGLGGNPNAGTNTQNSFALLQSLRAQELTAKSQLAESANRYGENWPAVAEQHARLEIVQDSIQQEVHRLGERAHSDYDVALQAESAARDAFTQQRDLASRLTGNAVALRLARQEADGSRTLYTTLLGRLQETGILEGLHSGNFAVVSPALVPSPDHPTSPSLPMLGALALAAGTVLGCSAALARELTDNAVRTAADLEALLDAPVFAAVPAYSLEEPWYRRILPISARSGLTLQADAGSEFEIPMEESPFVEALQCLRASLLISHSGQVPQIITFTDATPEISRFEAQNSLAGAPPLALSLAAVLAQHGSSVLFVDADLRSGSPGSTSSDPGLTEMLSSEAVLPFTQSIAGLPLLSVVHAGARPPCPAELIASSRMNGLLASWRDEFNFIVIHSPASVFADALVLAQLSDAVLLTAWAGETKRAEVLPAWQALSRQVPDHAVLGLVLESASRGVPYAHA